MEKIIILWFYFAIFITNSVRLFNLLLLEREQLFFHFLESILRSDGFFPFVFITLFLKIDICIFLSGFLSKLVIIFSFYLIKKRRPIVYFSFHKNFFYVNKELWKTKTRFLKALLLFKLFTGTLIILDKIFFNLLW